ncbi:MAG: DUF3618 domain-containing protein [Actinomycetota bacterium]|nr:DUF3618 domain-containing protein [Actinomycetota bacterium]
MSDRPRLALHEQRPDQGGLVAAGANPPRADQTPEQIVSDIEGTREQLAQTIDALVDRTNPKNVAARTLDSVKAAFFAPDGSPRMDQFAKVGGAVVGVIAVVVVLRRVVGD